MKNSQLFILSGNIFLTGSLLTINYSSSVFLGVLMCVWYGMGIYAMHQEKLRKKWGRE